MIGFLICLLLILGFFYLKDWDESEMLKSSLLFKISSLEHKLIAEKYNNEVLQKELTLKKKEIKQLYKTIEELNKNNIEDILLE